MAPWQESRRLRDGSSGGDHSKPKPSTALDRSRKRTSSMAGLDVLGCADCEGGGGARQLLGIWSRQWQAVVQLAVIAPTKRDQIARSCRGMLVRAGEENRRNLSVGRKWGTWVYSRRKRSHLQVLKSSAPLLFPRRSLGAERMYCNQPPLPLPHSDTLEIWKGLCFSLFPQYLVPALMSLYV